MANISLAHRQVAQQAQRRSAKTASIPAPTGGWNARDPLGQMAASDAVSLDNFWPLPYDVMVRKGYSTFVTGFSGQVESLMVYTSPTAQKMFAASGTAFYDASSAGAVGAAVVTGLTNARWESINISTSGGNFMLCVNGTNKLRGYSGSAWWTDGDGTHDITGVDTATITNINLFKNRVWLVQGNSLKAWYLPTDSIAGAASAINLQSICRLGGYLIAMGTWTIDAGYGVDDMAVFITSMGEVAVFRGTDPSSITTWALAGLWQIGSPFTPRCMMKFGGDLLVLTFDGLFPLAQALQSSRLDPRVALTDKIYTAISQATSDYSANFGWDMMYYAKANMLMLNIPTFAGSQQAQYCMNTITKAWCSFSGLSANTWANFGDEPYFGGSTYVGKFWNSFDDNGGLITGNAQQAYNYFNMRGQTKRWTLIRPTLRSNGYPAATAILNVDFTDYDAFGQLSFSPITSAVWGTATWDNGAWGSDLNVTNIWQGINGMGYCAGLRIKVAGQGIETHWAATDFVMEPGGVL